MENISSLTTIRPSPSSQLSSDKLFFPKSVYSISNNSFLERNVADAGVPISTNVIDAPSDYVPSLSSTPPYSPQNHTFHNSKSDSVVEQQLHHLPTTLLNTSWLAPSTGMDDTSTRLPCLSNSFAKLSSSEEVLVFLFLFWFQPLLVALGVVSNLSMHARLRRVDASPILIPFRLCHLKYLLF